MRILELLSSPVWTGPAEPMASVARELVSQVVVEPACFRNGRDRLRRSEVEMGHWRRLPGPDWLRLVEIRTVRVCGSEFIQCGTVSSF